MSIELVSYSDLENLLNINNASINDYPALNVLRDSVTAALEAFTGRLFESKARSETLYIGNTSTAIIKLDAIPVSSVASLTVTISDDVETYTLHDDYELMGYGLKLYSKIKNAVVNITYTGGISTVPDSLKRAALLQTAYEFQAKDQIGAETVSTEGGTVTRPALGLLSEVKRLLAPHMHPLRW
jgi:hypothetical protein